MKSKVNSQQLSGKSRKGDHLKPLARTRPVFEKCFICNQSFYSQINFDQHMQQHFDKLSSNDSQSVQRKTMQSFKQKNPYGQNIKLKSATNFIKKNTMLTSKISQRSKQRKEKVQQIDRSQITNKFNVTQTAQISQNDKPNYTKQTCSEVMRQSLLLLQKLDELTMNEKQGEMNQISFVNQSPTKQETLPKPTSQDEMLQKVMKEQEFINQVTKGVKAETIIHRVVFVTPEYNNYQYQLSYLSELIAIDPYTNTQKVQALRQQIIQKLVQVVCKHRTQFQQNMQLYMTEPLKTKMGCKSSIFEDNREVAYCAQCYSDIVYGSSFYELNCGHKYHQECWQSSNDCC